MSSPERSEGGDIEKNNRLGVRGAALAPRHCSSEVATIVNIGLGTA